MENRKENGELEREVLSNEANQMCNEEWDEQKIETEYDLIGTALNEL